VVCVVVVTVGHLPSQLCSAERVHLREWRVWVALLFTWKSFVISYEWTVSRSVNWNNLYI